MPKVSKVKVPASSTRAGEIKPAAPAPDKYQCARCGRLYKQLRNNFPPSQSKIFAGNGGYIPVCYSCVEDLFIHYREKLGMEGAIRRICLKFDIYWSPDVYAMVYKGSTNTSRIKQYISRTNLVKFIGKTYDDTIDEEGLLHASASGIVDEAEAEAVDDDGSIKKSVTSDQVKFWGAGFPQDVYYELDGRYERWTRDVPKPIDSGAEALYRQICILEVTITRNAITGKPIESAVNTLNTLIGSVNAKPVQKKMDEAVDTSFDLSPFGVGIKMLEATKPVPKPLPEFEDADHVKKYLSTWVVGHLCKLFGIKNANNKLYEAELEKYRIERPDLDEYDDEDFFAEVIGGDDA